VFASAADAGRVDALLKRAYKWSFSKDIVTFNELYIRLAPHFFKNAFPVTLSESTPTIYKIISYSLRNSDNSYILPQCKLNFLSVRLLTGVFLLCN